MTMRKSEFNKILREAITATLSEGGVMGSALSDVVWVSYGTDKYDPNRFKQPDFSHYLAAELNKPYGGLWASPINSKWGWKDWCQSEGYATETLNTSFMFKLSPSAKIYIIDNLEDLKEISTRQVEVYHGRNKSFINFQQLLNNGYDALYVTDKAVSSLRFATQDYADLYAWDCESICVFNKDVIIPIDNSQQEINEDVIEELDLYHGSPASFEHFDLAFLSTGFGMQVNGYGVYLTTSPDTAREYSQGGYLYTVEVPEGKYLDGRRISRSEAMTIAKKFFKFYTTEHEYGREAYAGYEREFWDNECKYIGECEDGQSIYGTIASFLGDDKETSEFLLKLGYIGLTIPEDNSSTGEKFTNYIIFDPNSIRVVKKEKL